MNSNESTEPTAHWRGLVFQAAFYIWTILLLPVGIAAAVLSVHAMRRLSRLWARGALGLLASIVGLRHRVRGTEHLRAGPVMLAVKHQSTWETIALNLLVRGPSFVLKRELTRIPVFGWLLTGSGMIAVDRAGGAAALREMVAEARARLAEGRSIVIFPEGTRTAPGQRHRYHPGVAALYAALDVPVVPVALNSGLFWPRRSTRLQRGLLTIEFLPPIAPGLPRREFAARLETAIEDTTDHLVDDALDIHPYLEKIGGQRSAGAVCG